MTKRWYAAPYAVTTRSTLAAGAAASVLHKDESEIASWAPLSLISDTIRVIACAGVDFHERNPQQ